jgi:hypothetical protein
MGGREPPGDCRAVGAMRMSAGSQRKADRRIRRVALAAGAGLWLVASSTGIATAQTPGPEPVRPASEGAPPPPSDKPGLITSFGNWVQKGFANMGAGFGTMVGALRGGADQAARNAADAASTAASTATSIARETATTVTRLPTTGIIGGREQCTLAPNGAPDCRVAAEVLCRSKGYGSGTSVDFETAEKCPPPYRVSGGNTPEGVCTMEHFVTRALCQ